MNTPNQTPAFTPGPWRFDGVAMFTKTGNVLFRIDPISAEGRLYHAANSRLCAAAPAMLEALRQAEAALSDRGRWVSDDAQAAYLACSRAIQQAEGRT